MQRARPGRASHQAVRETNPTRSLSKALIAGLVAGVIATAAKSLAERFYPPRTHGEPEPPEELAERLAGHKLSPQTKHIAAEGLHWAFGAAAGAAYGALAEYYPAATAKEGAAFGMALMTLTHDTALPALDLGADPEDQTPREHTSEIASHVLYGVVAEKVRGWVRRAID